MRGNASVFFALPEHIPHTLHSGPGRPGFAESGQADIALPAGPKARAGGSGHIGLGQHLVKKVPGAHAVGNLQPDIGGVYPAEAGQAGGGQALPDDPGILPVVADVFRNLPAALFGVDGCGPPLDHIGHAVELGGLAAVPHAVQRYAAPPQLYGHHGVGQDGNIDVAVEQFPPQYGQTAPAEEVCQALRIAPSALTGAPVQAVSTSRFKLMVPLAGKAVLDSLEPDFQLLWALCDRYGATGFYPFALETGHGAQPVLYARQFPNRAGYNEDPATGVAASALAAYLAAHRLVPVRQGWNQFTVFQGEAMGRPSVIYSDVYVEESGITRTRIRGNARIVSTG